MKHWIGLAAAAFAVGVPCATAQANTLRIDPHAA